MRTYSHERPCVSSKFWNGMAWGAPMSALLWAGILYLGKVLA